VAGSSCELLPAWKRTRELGTQGGSSLSDDSASSAETQGFRLRSPRCCQRVGDRPSSAPRARSERAERRGADDSPPPDWVTTELDVLIPGAVTSLDTSG
jgi:hypothetical protein